MVSSDSVVISTMRALVGDRPRGLLRRPAFRCCEPGERRNRTHIFGLPSSGETLASQSARDNAHVARRTDLATRVAAPMAAVAQPTNSASLVLGGGRFTRAKKPRKTRGPRGSFDRDV